MENDTYMDVNIEDEYSKRIFLSAPSAVTIKPTPINLYQKELNETSYLTEIGFNDSKDMFNNSTKPIERLPQMEDEVEVNFNSYQELLKTDENLNNSLTSVDNNNNDGRTKNIESTKQVFDERQKFAYLALVRVLLTDTSSKFPFQFKEFASANASYTQFATKIMKELYLHLNVENEEKLMVEKLTSHGVLPQDLAKPLLHNIEVRISSFTTENTIHVTIDSTKSSDSSENTLPTTTDLIIDIRWTMILDLFLLLTRYDIYDSRSRTLIRNLAKILEIEWFDVVKMEKQVAEQFHIAEMAETLTERHEHKIRSKLGLKSRVALMGVATVGGGLIIGLSAGLFAPVIGAGIGAALTSLGWAAGSGFFGTMSGAALITTGGVVAGGTIAGQKMEKRTRGVSTFQFLTINDQLRCSVVLSITGWLPTKIENCTKPYAVVDPLVGDHFSLLWEPEALQALGSALRMLAGEVLSFAAQEILKQTLLPALLAALALPMALAKLGYLVDNPWSNGLALAEKTGLVLADVLLNRAQGHRPVTLVGFSLGARVIFYCLQELARVKAFGIVENVYIFGAPVTASQKQWRECASTVSGRFVNGYIKSDWILGFLYRASSANLTIAGLNPVKDVDGVENFDASQLVSGHLAYRQMMPILMKEVGIPVTAESFEDEDEEDGTTDLEVSDNLEAVISGGATDPTNINSKSFATGPKPKGGSRSKSWYDHKIFDKLRWTGRSKSTNNSPLSSSPIDSSTSLSESSLSLGSKAKLAAQRTKFEVDPYKINIAEPDLDDSNRLNRPPLHPMPLAPRSKVRSSSQNDLCATVMKLDLNPPSQARTKHR